jgi:hypothetical protein
MVVEKASGRDSPLRQGAGKSSGGGGGLQYVSRKSDLSLQYVLRKSDLFFRFFPLRGFYRRKGIVRRWATWPHHVVARPHLASPCGGAARGWAAPAYGEPGPWPPSVSSSVFVKLQ